MNIDIGFASALARTGFDHRSARAADGNIVYRLADGSGHVTVPASEWQSILDVFGTETKAIRRRANIALLSLLPAIFIFGMTIGQILPGAGLVIVIAFFGGPIAIYLWQSSKVQKVSAVVETCLAQLPRTAAPPEIPERPPRWLDIAAILLVGPWLVLALIGEIGGPDTFRNTPLKGTRFGWEASMAFAVLCLRWAWPYLPFRALRGALDQPPQASR